MRGAAERQLHEVDLEDLGLGFLPLRHWVLRPTRLCHFLQRLSFFAVFALVPLSIHLRFVLAQHLQLLFLLSIRELSIFLFFQFVPHVCQVCSRHNGLCVRGSLHRAVLVLLSFLLRMLRAFYFVRLKSLNVWPVCVWVIQTDCLWPWTHIWNRLLIACRSRRLLLLLGFFLVSKCILLLCPGVFLSFS